jgi:hypothetical protein
MTDPEQHFSARSYMLDMNHLFENPPRRTDVILGALADDRLAVGV